MNYIQETTKLWTFPETISYENVPGYLSFYMEQKGFSEFIFDLSRTITLHSSFIGFLIHIKQQSHKKNISIKLILSPTAGQILKMLDLHDFLTSDLVEFKKPKKKSA